MQDLNLQPLFYESVRLASTPRRHNLLQTQQETAVRTSVASVPRLETTLANLAISVFWSALGAGSFNWKSKLMCNWFAVFPVLRFLTAEQNTFIFSIEQCWLFRKQYRFSMTGSLIRAATTSAFNFAVSAAVQEPPTILNGFFTPDGGLPSKRNRLASQMMWKLVPFFRIVSLALKLWVFVLI